MLLSATNKHSNKYSMLGCYISSSFFMLLKSEWLYTTKVITVNRKLAHSYEYLSVSTRFLFANIGFLNS